MRLLGGDEIAIYPEDMPFGLDPQHLVSTWVRACADGYVNIPVAWVFVRGDKTGTGVVLDHAGARVMNSQRHGTTVALSDELVVYLLNDSPPAGGRGWSHVVPWSVIREQIR